MARVGGRHEEEAPVGGALSQHQGHLGRGRDRGEFGGGRVFGESGLRAGKEVEEFGEARGRWWGWKWDVQG